MAIARRIEEESRLESIEAADIQIKSNKPAMTNSPKFQGNSSSGAKEVRIYLYEFFVKK